MKFCSIRLTASTGLPLFAATSCTGCLKPVSSSFGDTFPSPASCRSCARWRDACAFGFSLGTCRFPFLLRLFASRRQSVTSSIDGILPDHLQERLLGPELDNDFANKDNP